ncbi:MAG: hypothetical protein ACLVJH_15955 [Faecalibacterium prausnitzii]
MKNEEADHPQPERRCCHEPDPLVPSGLPAAAREHFHRRRCKRVTKTGTGKGFGGDIVATLTVESDGTVSDCKLEGASETESIGGAALEELAKQVVAANGAEHRRRVRCYPDHQRREGTPSPPLWLSKLPLWASFKAESLQTKIGQTVVCPIFAFYAFSAVGHIMPSGRAFGKGGGAFQHAAYHALPSS